MNREEIIKGLKIATRKIGGCYDNGGWLSDDESKAIMTCEQVIKGLEENRIILVEEQQMEFPNTWEEFEKVYGFTDKEEVYTNGIRLIPSFRVKQWLDHIYELNIFNRRSTIYDTIEQEYHGKLVDLDEYTKTVCQASCNKKLYECNNQCSQVKMLLAMPTVKDATLDYKLKNYAIGMKGENK